MKRPTLPLYYYLDHFMEMLEFVRTTYGEVLIGEHHAFMAQFRTLSKDAQCLLIRMVNRRGSIFNRVLFKYAEISDIERAASDLIACGLARVLEAADYAAFVSCLPKETLANGARAAGHAEVRLSWSKPKLVAYVLAEVPFAVAAEQCGGSQFIALSNTRPIEFLLYLYFGKTENDLKSFALRDLGVLRTNTESAFSARFTDADEARVCFYYSQLLDRLATPAVAVYGRAADEILLGPLCPSNHASDLRSNAACIIGQFFERNDRLDLALKLYSAGSSPECNERLVRLLYAQGDKASAEERLRQMIDDPASDSELIFATDFHARKFGGRRTGLCTELLRAARTIVVDDAYRGNPEAGVAGVMRRQGSRVFFAENMLWHALFGLLFWDELFESGHLHSGFDWVPHCLKDRSFARTFAVEIETKLNHLRSGHAMT
ncbi:MAG TPA: exonuclease, partial [Bradyrhizobium sp.]|nr:exonuclease [Bradyrhizobium sp.]